ncbi:hypothetical protein [Allokutzneria sp. A3M-2-11 16]|nr:hypothetical protein [Allokutzneria sp. A3M-2-11 16]
MKVDRHRRQLVQENPTLQQALGNIELNLAHDLGQHFRSSRQD